MYTQVIYCLERVPAVVKAKPELKDVEPFKTVLSGNREAMAKLSMKDLEKILAATLTGMTVEQFGAEVKAWLATTKHPRFKRPYTELVYQPMLEVMQYLRDNTYKIFIVTGGGQDFVRVYAEQVYGKAGTVSNEIVSHLDWLPTLLAMAGDPTITEKLGKDTR